MDLSQIRTRLQTDKQLQMIVGVSAVILVLLVVLVIVKMSGGKSSAVSANSPTGAPVLPGMPGMPGMPGAAPGATPGAAGGAQGAAGTAVAGTSSNTTATSASSNEIAGVTTGTSGSAETSTTAGGSESEAASLKKGPPMNPYRSDPFKDRVDSHAAVRQLKDFQMPRIHLAALKVRIPKEAKFAEANYPSVNRRVAGIMNDRVVSAILEEDGQAKVVQAGDEYHTSLGTRVRVEKIDSGGVTLREGSRSFRVPLRPSDVAIGGSSNTELGITGVPGVGTRSRRTRVNSAMPGMLPGM